jgi:hypothetical protein
MDQGTRRVLLMKKPTVKAKKSYKCILNSIKIKGALIKNSLSKHWNLFLFITYFLGHLKICFTTSSMKTLTFYCQYS